MARFSRRNDPEPDAYVYAIPDRVRTRLLVAIQDSLREGRNPHVSLQSALDEMEGMLMAELGELRTSNRRGEHPVVDHFYCCPDEEVMDFFEMIFETQWACGGQLTVAAINRVLEGENIGYELTPYIEKWADEGEEEDFDEDDNGQGGYLIRQLPKAIRKDEKTLHAEVVKPCLAALADDRFASASDELLNAFEECRQRKFADAITDAGSAFESVLKIICTEKGWHFDKDKDACAKLLGICNENGLFHSFYKQILEGTASVRNKVGDAHGKGTKAEYPATKELADHMLYMVCNNINLVIGLAEL